MKLWKKHWKLPKIRKQAGAVIALALTVLLAASLLSSAMAVRTAAASTDTENNTLDDGTYELNASLQSATNKDKASMGNAALKKPLRLVVEDGKGTLSLEFITMTVTLGTTEFTGYLGDFSYLLSEEDTVPQSTEEIYPATITAYYSTYDRYNDPDTGTDSNVKGKKYPKKAEIPVTIGDDFIWVQVYVPVMESVTSGAGRQYARLVLDWDSLESVTEETETAEASETVKADRSELKKQIAAAKKLAAKDTVYTMESLNALKTAIRNAQTFYNDKTVGQTEIDAQTINLLKAKEALKKRVNVDKSALKTQLKKAKALVSQSGVYTVATRKVLKAAITEAAEVYKNADASAKEVSAQVTALKEAQKGLIRKDSKKLNKNKLADGTYTLYGSMVKTDKVSQSMANEAISHQVLLTVKNGAYYLTVSFTSMKINGQNGYLGRLRYYKTGYTLDSNNNPKGTLASVSVDAYQTAGGKRVSDNLGTDYPAKVTFPLISEGIKTGYVPLQVFVPVMDAISAGTGTQSVYLKLNWTTLKKKSSGTGSLDVSKVKAESSKEVLDESGDDSENESAEETKSVEEFRAMTGLPDADASENEPTDSLTNTTLEGEGNAGIVSLTDTNQTYSSENSAEASASNEAVTTQNGTNSDYDTLLEKILPVLISALSVAMGVFYKVWSRKS